MIYKRSMFQKAVSLLLAASLLVPGMGATARAEAPVESVEKPQLRVVGTLTDGGKYLELGLSIASETGSFQSAGALLKYDATKLTPLKWGTVEDESGVLADAKINVPAATATNAAWKEAAILPTKSKGADDLVGKTAKAVKLSESATSAYLYLSAEAPKGQLLNQTLPIEKDTAPTGLPPATANGKTITAIGAAEATADQVVTVRFLVGTTTDAEEGAAEQNYTLAELVAAIDLVVYDSATPNADELALLRGSPLAIPGGTPTKLEGLSYIADNADYTTAGFTTAVDVSFVWIAEGQTVDSGGGGKAEDFASIVFYDWDETLLGSIVVPKGKDATEDVRAFVMSKMSAESRDYTLQAGNEDTVKPYFIDDKNYPLTYKKGYSLQTWIPFESSEPTSYGARVASNNMNNMADINAETDAEKQLVSPTKTADFSSISESLIVKAAYVSNSECMIGTTQLDRQYEIEPIAFGRYGATNNFTIELRIKRNAVPKAAVPLLRVKMTIGSTTLISLYELNGSDMETIKIVPYTTNTAGVDKIVWTVVDAYGISDMNSAAQRTNENATYSSRGTITNLVCDGSSRAIVLDGTESYMHKCILGGINIALKEYNPNKAISTITDINNAVLRSIGIGVGSLSANVMKQRLYDKWAEKNISNGVVHSTIIDLSRQEIIDALGTAESSPILPKI